ncbi:Imm43 family immunity protein [Iodobacter fluviatilis]|nr:DUF1629 domain-containing protein [Iodobacter fluviatilis]
MDFYVLTHDEASPFLYGDASFSPIDLGCYSNLWQTKFVPDGNFCKITLSKNAKKVSLDLFTVNSGFVMSEKALAIFSAPDLCLKINPIPTEIYSKNGDKIYGTYYFTEFFDWLDLFDYENSIYELDEEGARVDSCSRLTLRNTSELHLDLFFLKDVNLFEPIISKKLMDLILSSKIRGYKSVPLSEFKWKS